MSETTSTISTKNLKRVLGFWDLMGNAVGQIIGTGIMSLTGIAIAYTGRSVPISFLISSILVLVAAIPIVVVSGTIRVRGGEYTLMGLLAGKRFSGVFIFLFLLQQVAIASYSLSFAHYLIALIPGLGGSVLLVRIIAVGTLALFYGVNLLGIKEAANAQKIIVLLMIVALGLFIGFGMKNVSNDYFTAPEFFSGGTLGVMLAGSMLTMAMSGGYMIVNLSGEAKNPTRDIPLAIVASTLGVSVIYALIGVVASGVLPTEVVANEILSLVAHTILPNYLYVFFIIGGAMCALVSTLNAQLQWATKPLMQACVDGWLPAWMAKLNKRNSPKYLLTLLWFIGAVPILVGLEIENITNVCVVTVSILTMIISIGFVRLPKVIPDIWEKSKYRMSKTWLIIISTTAVLMGIMNIGLMSVQLSPILMGLPIVLLVLAYLYAYWRCKSEKIQMEISYEEL